jgi:hypothetical protein
MCGIKYFLTVAYMILYKTPVSLFARFKWWTGAVYLEVSKVMDSVAM